MSIRGGVTVRAEFRPVAHRPYRDGMRHDSDDDPVAANRAVHPRRTPGRPELGIDVTRRAAIAAMVVVAVATAILVVVVLSTS